jgi:hypothetical protein
MYDFGLFFEPTPTIFGGGRLQTVLTLYDALSNAGKNVCLVHTDIHSSSSSEPALYPSDLHCDMSGYNVVFLKDHVGGCSERVCEYIIDVDGIYYDFLRSSVGKKTIVFLRNSAAFELLERSVYNVQKRSPNLENVAEVWVWDIFNSVNDIQLLESMIFGGGNCGGNGNGCVKTIPFVWSPLFVEEYMRREKIVYPTITDDFLKKEYVFHISEKNVDNTSSCVFPIVFMNELSKRRIFKNGIVYVNNGDSLITNHYFQDNIVKNISQQHSTAYMLNNQDNRDEIIQNGGFAFEFIGRERYVDLVMEKTMIITHSRFVPFRIGLLDLLWLGIPFIHNSKYLADIGFNMNYYENNSVEMAIDAIKDVNMMLYCKQNGHDTVDNISKRFIDRIDNNRKVLLLHFGIYSKKNVDRWSELLKNM